MPLRTGIVKNFQHGKTALFQRIFWAVHQNPGEIVPVFTADLWVEPHVMVFIHICVAADDILFFYISITLQVQRSHLPVRGPKGLAVFRNLRRPDDTGKLHLLHSRILQNFVINRLSHGHTSISLRRKNPSTMS